jgi:hypothetical protein
MKFFEKIIYMLINIGLLIIFFLSGERLLTPEYFFEYRKSFAFAALLFLLAEFIKMRIASATARKIRNFLESIAFSESKEIQEISPDSALYPSYKALLRILQKSSNNQKGVINLNHEDLFQVFNPENSYNLRTQIKTGLQKIHKYLPNSELYVFFVEDNSIELIEQYGSDEQEHLQKLTTANQPFPFSLKSDFSGLVFRERNFLISNELKSDPNLGQFMSGKNPNIPIYGGLFSIGQNPDFCGLLWIRDGASALDFVKIHQSYFDFFCSILQKELFQNPGQFLFAKPEPEELFLHFEQKAAWLLQLAKTEKRVFSSFILYFRCEETKIDNCIQKARQIISGTFPSLSCFCRRGNLIYGAINNEESMQALIHISTVFDDCARFFSLENTDNSSCINMGISIVEPEQKSLTLPESLQECQEALRKAITQNENCLRIFE